MNVAVLSLRGRRTWTPSELLTAPASEIWPAAQHLVALGVIAQFIGSESSAAPDQAVVSPGGVDPDTGAIRATRRGFPGPIRTVGTNRAAGLRVGDLLVPPVPRAHTLLLGPEHSGFAFSATYRTLRPIAEIDGLQLWALLNSTAGQAARQAAAVTSVIPSLTVSRLLALEVPVIPADRWSQLRDAAASLHHAPAAAATAEVGQSWWRVARLPRGRNWSTYLATRNPEALEEGTTLGELAAEIQRGLPIKTLSDVSHQGWLPYLALRDLRTGREPVTWAAPSSVIAQPGDIVVAEACERGPSSVVSTPLIPGAGVCLIRLRDTDLAPRVVAYLNSEPGQADRALYVTGSVIPQLAPKALRSFRIPEAALAGETPSVGSEPPSPEPLAERLDALLWS